MARAEKIVEADIQVDSFVVNLSNWLRTALKNGKVTKVTAITDDEPEYDTAKTDGQREKFHSMIGDIQKTGVILIPGRRIVMSDYDLEQCKTLLVKWFAEEKAMIGEPLAKPPRSFLDPISGERMLVRPSTVPWGKKLTRDFVEWLYKTGAECSTKWSEKGLEAYESYREAQQ